MPRFKPEEDLNRCPVITSSHPVKSGLTHGQEKKNLLNTKINVLPNDLSFYRNRHLPSLSAPTKLQLGPDKPKVVCQPPLPHIQKITLNMWKPHGSETDPERNRNGFFIASEPERKSEM